MMKIKKISQKATFWMGAVILGVAIGMVVQFSRAAWNEPPAGFVPPDGNVEAPLNANNIGQYKRGGLMLNTDGLPTSNGLIVQNGDVNIGTPTNPDTKTNIIDVKDAWVRDANGGAGEWASALSGGTLAASNFYNRSNGAGNYGVSTQLDCLSGDTAVSGSCFGVDVCSGSDTTNFGGYPSGNGWFCPAMSCTRVRTFVRCYSTKSPTPAFCSNGDAPGDISYGSWGACNVTNPYPSNYCVSTYPPPYEGAIILAAGEWRPGTQTQPVYTCQNDGSLQQTGTQSQGCTGYDPNGGCYVDGGGA